MKRLIIPFVCLMLGVNFGVAYSIQKQPERLLTVISQLRYECVSKGGKLVYPEIYNSDAKPRTDYTRLPQCEKSDNFYTWNFDDDMWGRTTEQTITQFLL